VELPFILPSDLSAECRIHRSEFEDAIRRVLDSAWYILGKEVAAFEEEFARYCGVEHGVGVASGTDALLLALRVLGIGPGDAVLTVSHTAVATVAAIELAGAVPVLVDVGSETYTMDPEALAATLQSFAQIPNLPQPCRPKAVIPVHLYGHPADLGAILPIAAAHGLAVVEDCAQAHGASLQGRRVGGWGRLAAFSFYPTKNLGALGDGGALVTADKPLMERARSLREYGWRDRYVSDVPGMNTRLDELQAALLRAKLRYLEADNERRRTIASTYDRALSSTGLRLPVVRDGVVHAFHQYVVRTPRRDALRAHLKSNAVGSLIHYPVPVHLQPAYRGRVPLGVTGMHVTEQVVSEILSLPMHPYLTAEQIGRVTEAIVAWGTAEG
jgi:dTDP-4-amino-4,6-dideoxygalactose transaminase